MKCLFYQYLQSLVVRGVLSQYNEMVRGLQEVLTLKICKGKKGPFILGKLNITVGVLVLNTCSCQQDLLVPDTAKVLHLKTQR